MSSALATAWTVEPGARWFTRGGDVHVPLLDTVWNAFAETEEREWDDYLRHRRAQGFTGVMVSALPTWHDRSENPGCRTPYAVRDDGGFDFDRVNMDYFAVARHRVARIVAHGLTPVVVVLWSNYVDGSAPNGLRPGMTLPEHRRAELVSWIVDDLTEFEPALLLSGDDPFTTDESLRVFLDLLEQLADRAPGLLRSFHMWPDASLPRELAAHPALDFVTLQSGHTDDDGAKAIELAAAASTQFADKPILNLEPCYEGHRHVRSSGRFSRTEVRRVLWTSFVSGAAAGVGYGAHGVWSWHRAGSTFLAAEFSGAPFPWQVALGFAGATDAAFARRLWEEERLFATIPAQELLGSGTSNDSDGTRAAASADRIVVYLPAARELALQAPVDRIRGWDLTTRAPLVPAMHRTGTGVRIEQPDVNGDVVLVMEKVSE